MNVYEWKARKRNITILFASLNLNIPSTFFRKSVNIISLFVIYLKCVNISHTLWLHFAFDLWIYYYSWTHYIFVNNLYNPLYKYDIIFISNCENNLYVDLYICILSCLLYCTQFLYNFYAILLFVETLILILSSHRMSGKYDWSRRCDYTFSYRDNIWITNKTLFFKLLLYII